MMRYLTLIFSLFFMVHAMNGQTDSLLTISIMNKKPLPQIGIGANGIKYFVMSVNQDKRTIMELRKDLYKDSLIEQYEMIMKSYGEEVSLLNGRLGDKDAIIADKNLIIWKLEENYEDMVLQLANCNKNVKDQQQYINRKKLGWWFAVGVGIAGSILYIDSVLEK